MKLKQVIELLEKFPRERKVAHGFGDPHSWRGSYDEVAFAPVDDTTVGQMLDDARSAVGTTYHGYKGGEYLMGLETNANIDYHGSWSDGELDYLFYNWLTEEEY